MFQQQLDPGCVVFSVDVPDQGVEESRVRELFELFNSQHLPATWATGLKHARLVSSFARESGVSHEVAVLGDATWLPGKNSRRTFYRALVERMRGFRDERAHVTTLALDKVDLFDHLDLLVKHRISMVRCDSTTGGPEIQCRKPRSLRFGVWQAPPARRLTGRSNIGWWTTMNIRRLIHRCSRRGGIVHLLLQADELLNRGMLETILRCVANRHKNDSLGCLTLQQLSRQVQMQPPRITSQSLLNRAA
jgi:hypothetical protein